MFCPDKIQILLFFPFKFSAKVKIDLFVRIQQKNYVQRRYERNMILF